jgi:hypothetical protein
LSREEIEEMLELSETFNEIKEWNLFYLGEGTNANVFEILEDLESLDNYPSEFYKITATSVRSYNLKLKEDNKNKSK